MTQTKIDLGVIQETLLITLWARARELQEPDPIIIDPKSAEIVAAIDYDFDKFATAKDSQIGCCLRGMILDNWVKSYLQQHPQGTVIEIGAGLNTRFERVDNGEVRWFDLDLPDSMKFVNLQTCLLNINDVILSLIACYLHQFPFCVIPIVWH